MQNPSSLIETQLMSVFTHFPLMTTYLEVAVWGGHEIEVATHSKALLKPNPALQLRHSPLGDP